MTSQQFDAAFNSTGIFAVITNQKPQKFKFA
jgi:hypothetical protein